MANAYGFESKSSTASDLIDLVKSSGRDVGEFQSELDSIVKSTKDSVSSLDSSVSKHVKSMSLDSLYTDAYNDLDNLVDRLGEDDKILKIHFRLTCLKDKVLNSDNLDIKSLIEEILMIIVDVRRFNTNEFEAKKTFELIRFVYEVSYEIIKLELIEYGSSTLLSYIKDSNLGVEFITDCVRKDIETIDLREEYNLPVKKRMEELYCDGINYNFADENLIMLLLMRLDDRLLNKLTDLYSRFDYINNKHDLYNKEEELEREVFEYFDDKIDEIESSISRKKLNRILALIAVIGNFATFMVTSKNLKDNCINTTYLTERTIYDTLSEEEVAIPPIYENKYNHEVIIVEYGEVAPNGRRTVHTHIEKEDTFESFDEIIAHYHEHVSSTGHTSPEFVTYSAINQKSSEPYIAVERISYSSPVEHFDEETYNNSMSSRIRIFSSIGTVFLLSSLISTLRILNLKLKRKRLLKENEVSKKELEEVRILIETLESKKAEINSKRFDTKELREKIKSKNKIQ